MVLASELGSCSACRRGGANLGCVLVREDFSEVVGIGYNGPAAGESHDTCRGPEAVGSCGCIHAEANAVSKMRVRGEPLVAIMTMSPCELCAGLLINTRSLIGVIYEREYRDTTGLDRLRRAGIPVASYGSVLAAVKGEFDSE